MTHDIAPVRTAVFPVAGLGTRFLPATKAIPKEMLIVGDRPLIQHAVEEAVEAGIEEFIFVISHGKEMLLRHFEEAASLLDTLEGKGKADLAAKVRASTLQPGSLKHVFQEQALGLGHAVWCAKDLVKDRPFAVILPDDLIHHKVGCLAQMVTHHNAIGGNMVAVEEVAIEDTQKYGILDYDSGSGRLVRIKGLVEKPKPEDAPSRLAITGRYILEPEIFDILQHGEKGTGGEIQLTDAMAKLLLTQSFHGVRFAGERFDCGSQAGFLKANLTYGLEAPGIGEELKEFMASKLKHMNQGNPVSRQQSTLSL